MRTSMVFATLAVAGTGAVGAGATFGTQPYQGSDSLYDLTNAAISSSEIGTTGVNGSGLGNSGDYVGGGSGAGEADMAAAAPPPQWTAPMTKMLTSVSCSAVSPTHGTGLVIGLDALEIDSSTFAGGNNANCSTHSTAGNNGLGAAYNTTISYTVNNAAATTTFKNWTDMLALLYGGLDKSQSTKVTDCNSPARQALVAQWTNIFEAGSSTCSSNPTSACTTAGYSTASTVPTTGLTGVCIDPGESDNGTACTMGPSAVCGGSCELAIGGQLWHAFRRDDSSGTADVFSSLIGITTVYASNGAKLSGATSTGASAGALSFSVSATKWNGFGVSPYCNAINWDVTAANEPDGVGGSGGDCTLGKYKQFVGPGGVPQLYCSDGSGACTGDPTLGQACGTSTGTCQPDNYHRRPPPKVWGDTSYASTAKTIGADVAPTSYQDNDPIRRPCLGSNQFVGQAVSPAEEICNLDGRLGVILPVPAVDWIGDLTSGNTNPYPTAKCTTFNSGSAISAALCAPSGLNNTSVCPDGQQPIAGGCQIPATGSFPVSGGTGTSACENNPAKWPLRDGSAKDGRIFNLTEFSGIGAALLYPVPGTSVSVPFTGAFARIHQVNPIWDTSVASTPPALIGGGGQLQGGCQLTDASDQVGCLTQADPCSIGLGDDGSKQWNTHEGLSLAVSGTDALELSQIYPTAATIQGTIGASGTYPGWRKLYFNSSNGFDSINGTTSLINTKGPDPTAYSEFKLGEFEANGDTNIHALLSTYSLFDLGHSPNGGAGSNLPYCEDFNESLICGTTAFPSNLNACNYNANISSAVGTLPGEPNVSAGGTGTAATFPTSGGAAKPTLSTICGDGVVEDFEDCDNGLSDGTTGNLCSNTCRTVYP